MCMLCWMCGNTWRDKVRNEDIFIKIDIAPIEEKMRETAYVDLIMCDVHLQMHMMHMSAE